MVDREKVRTQLAGIGIGLDMAGYHNDAQCIRDALALLREQEEERKRIVIWLGKFCAHADQQYQPRFTDEANIEFFRQKMKQQFGWDVSRDDAERT